MYEDARDFVKRCRRYQKHGNINARDAMPLQNNLSHPIFRRKPNASHMCARIKFTHI
jgi:hypothetical protein